MTQPESFVVVENVSVAVTAAPSLVRSFMKKPVAQHSVLRNVSFSLTAGDQVTLFGGPGAGKSTLLRMLAGARKPDTGLVRVNGVDPASGTIKNIAAGYIASDEREPARETAYQVLHAFGVTHGVTNIPARIGQITETLGIGAVLNRPAEKLSTAEGLRLNIARAVLADSPLILLDDVADQLGAVEVLQLLQGVLAGRTVIIATRQVSVAEQLDLPILLLHQAQLVQRGTRDEIASAVAAERMLDIWVEGLRYDLFRNLKKHPGVASVRLLPATDFNGQRLRITLRSSHYLPSLYDAVSQASLIKVEEIPPSLQDIISRL